jgi:acetyltransferase-like isoleucine patch superfamily enzyme
MNMRNRVALLYTSLCHRGLVRGPRCIIPRRCSITDGSTLGVGVVLGRGVCLRKTQIGDYTYLGPNCNVTAASIGKFCSIASEVYIGLGSHPLAPFVSTHPIFYLRRLSQHWTFADSDYRSDYRHTTIGSDVWIGLRAAVRDGVMIGDGAIIATGAIVTRDVPPYAIVAGVPGRILRYRFPCETIQLLIEFKWWDRDEDWLRENWRMFHDITNLLPELSSLNSNWPSHIAVDPRAVI